MRHAALLLALFVAGTTNAAPGEDHWGEPSARGLLYQALAEARDLVESGDPASAVAVLAPLALEHPQDADVFNLLGYARRNAGDLEGSALAYTRALELDSDHLGALEYQGELFLMLGEPEKAQDNLARLTAICGIGCEERKDLASAIAAFPSMPVPQDALLSPDRP